MNTKPTKPQSGLIASLLFAIVVGVTIAAQGRYYKNLNWMEPKITAAAYRGADGAEKTPVFAVQQLAMLHGRLTRAVTDAFENARPAPRKLVFFGKKFAYAMDGQLTELFDGSLQITVTATANGATDPAKTWTATAEKGGDAAKIIQEFGAKVGAELSALPAP
ncbi:MAG: hypothetical protein U1F77_02345 [Kiritimatiellia bacterium]